MSKKQRVASYDVMRIVAITAVIACHMPIYHLFHNGHGASLVFGLATTGLYKIGAPLFAMVSGALLLGRNETYEVLWNKRISRMLLVILIFEAIHYACGCLSGQEKFSASEFAYGLFSGGLKGMRSYWFLYAYLGFLVMLPFLRRVAQSMTKSDFLWLMGVHIVCSTLPTIANFVSECFLGRAFVVSKSFNVALSSVFLFFFPIIGYWIDKHIDVQRITRRQWTLLATVTIAGLALSAWMTWFYDVRLNTVSQSHVSLTLYVTLITLFLAIKRIFGIDFTERRPRTSRAISFCAGLTFGVYLLDQPVKFFLYEPLKALLYAHHPFEPYGLNSAIIFSLTWVVLSFIICGSLTWVLKKLPVFKKLM